MTVEAEEGATNGRVIGPSRLFSTLPSEASGRRAVLLEQAGQFVDIRLPRAANGLTVRYALPDSDDGRGLDAALDLFVDGAPAGSLPLTSRYSWYYGRYPFSNRPADGAPHHFYDHARTLLKRTFPAGSVIRLAMPAGAAVGWVAVDLVDVESVPPPHAPPPNAISILTFGADPAGLRDSRPAFRAAIAEGRRTGRPVWIPAGTFRADGHIEVDRVTVRGAGPWYSIVRGHGVGMYGRAAPGGSRSVTLRDFAILGEVAGRDDKAALAGVGGSIGGGSSIANLFIQHMNVGVWLDGPLAGVRISDLRLFDLAADGINLRRGVSDAIVERVTVRNSGDDGIALWSQGQANHHIRLRDNVIIAPTLANGIAVYGGHDIEISGNRVADTLTQGGGLHLGNRFGAVPLSGRIELTRNIVERSGSFDPNWRFGVGALWFYALDHPIDATIRVTDLQARESSFPAIQFLGKRIRRVDFDGLRIEGASSALQIQSDGEATFRGLSVSGLTEAAVDRRDPRFVTAGWIDDPAAAK